MNVISKLFLFLFLYLFSPVNAFERDDGNASTEKLLMTPGQYLLEAKGQYGLVELDDGSQLKAVGSDIPAIEEWHQSDLLLLQYNHSLFFRGEFYIENVDRGESIYGDLIYPCLGEKRANGLTIRHIDPAYGQLFSKNFSGEVLQWQVCDDDWPCLKGWEQEDPIIIARNSWWDSLKNDGSYIIVNQKNKEMRSIHVQYIGRVIHKD